MKKPNNIWIRIVFLILALILTAPVLSSCGEGKDNNAQAGPEVEIFTNGNIQGVLNNPTMPTTFALDRSYKITSIINYHWNYSSGADPGTIGLKDSDGNTIGAWKAGEDSNIYWTVKPNIVLKAGTYTVLDSDIYSWSHNDLSENRGFTTIKGVALGTSATAKSDRTPLVSEMVMPSVEPQLVSYREEVGVIIPGGTLESGKEVVITPATNLPQLSCSGLTELAAYDIAIGDIEEFENPLVIEFAYDPASVPSDIPLDKYFSVGWWDTENEAWISSPFAVDTTRNVIMVPTCHLTSWKIWAKAKGWDWKENDHFVVFFDPGGKIVIGGKNAGNAQDFAAKVGSILDQAYIAYKDAGFDMSLTYVPAKAIGAFGGALAGGIIGWMAGGAGAFAGARVGLNAGGKLGAVVGAIVTGSKTNVFIDPETKDPNWSRYTGDISVPLDFDSYDNLQKELNHELFHAVQNSYYSIQGMDARRWWIEATAEYAAYRVAGQVFSGALPKMGHDFFQIPLTHENKFHEYQAVSFIDYLVGPDIAPEFRFQAMFEAVSKGDSSVFAPLNDYITTTTGKTLQEQYREFAGNAIFDSNSTLEKVKGTLIDSDLVEGPNEFASRANPLSHTFKLAANYTEKVWAFKAPPSGQQTTRGLKIELTGDVPEAPEVGADIYVIADGQRPAGGVNSKGTIDSGNKSVNLSVGAGETVYILAGNGSKNAQDVSIKVSDVVELVTPTSIDSVYRARVIPYDWSTGQSGAPIDCVVRYHMTWNEPDSILMPGKPFNIDLHTVQTEFVLPDSVMFLGDMVSGVGVVVTAGRDGINDFLKNDANSWDYDCSAAITPQLYLYGESIAGYRSSAWIKSDNYTFNDAIPDKIPDKDSFETPSKNIKGEEMLVIVHAFSMGCVYSDTLYLYEDVPLPNGSHEWQLVRKWQINKTQVIDPNDSTTTISLE